MLLLLPVSVASQLGPFDDKDEPEPMESFMDDSNLRYSDYLSGWTGWTATSPQAESEQSSAVFCPVSAGLIDWKGECWSVFDTSAVAPNVTKVSSRMDDYQFLISVEDAGLRRSICPVRDAELFRMHGFPEEMAKASVNLTVKDKAALFRDTVPNHSLVRIISVL